SGGPGSGLYISRDAGDTWKQLSGTALPSRPDGSPELSYAPGKGLPEGIWGKVGVAVAPSDGRRVYALIEADEGGLFRSDDGGDNVTVNAGETWYAPQLPIAQFYHVAADNRTPYHVCGAMQDIGTTSGPSNSLSSANITLCEWRYVGGGEAGYAVPDPSNPHIIYAGEYGGYISRYDDRTRQAQNISIYPTN